MNGIKLNSRLLAPTNIHKNAIILRWINGICNARLPMSNATLFKIDAEKPEKQHYLRLVRERVDKEGQKDRKGVERRTEMQ